MSSHSKVNEYAAKVLEMGSHSDTAQRVATRYEAHMSLFRVAASSEDEKEMEVQRDKLHNLLDTMLDSCMSLGKLSSEANKILRSLDPQ